MKRFVLAIVAIASISLAGTQTASAGNPSVYGFFPYGFYQPYGARYRSSLRTPPYFAVNPPVYYGSRHSRPYGISPFASPPVVSAPNSYRGRLQSRFYQPPTQTAIRSEPACVSHGPVANQPIAGAIRQNPFMSDAQLATN